MYNEGYNTKQLTCKELRYKKCENVYISPNFIYFLCGYFVLAVYFLPFFFKGISATSEDIPNKIEDLRSECSSDFGGKDSVTSPDMDEVTHGKKGK